MRRLADQSVVSIVYSVKTSVHPGLGRIVIIDTAMLFTGWQRGHFERQFERILKVSNCYFALSDWVFQL